MKYIGLIFCLILTMTLAASQAMGQTPYVASSGLSVAAPGLDSTQPNSIVTIQSRVNEVNVLFIAMDKRGDMGLGYSVVKELKA